MIRQTLQNATEGSDKIGILSQSSESGHRVESFHVSMLAKMFFPLPKQVQDTEGKATPKQSIKPTTQTSLSTYKHTNFQSHTQSLSSSC